jgi:hypothetical protein
MNERILREALSGPGENRSAEDASLRDNLARLGPEIGRAATRLREKREARRQNLLFLASALAFLLAAVFALEDWSRGGKALRGILLGGGVLMGLVLALSPLMAYWLEEEREHEKA